MSLCYTLNGAERINPGELPHRHQITVNTLWPEIAQKMNQKKVLAARCIKVSNEVMDGKEWEVCADPMPPIPGTKHPSLKSSFSVREYKPRCEGNTGAAPSKKSRLSVEPIGYIRKCSDRA